MYLLKGLFRYYYYIITMLYVSIVLSKKGENRFLQSSTAQIQLKFPLCIEKTFYLWYNERGYNAEYH